MELCPIIKTQCAKTNNFFKADVLYPVFFNKFILCFSLYFFFYHVKHFVF